jgi:hypothetical protein
MTIAHGTFEPTLPRSCDQLVLSDGKSMIRLFEVGYRSLQTGQICKPPPKGVLRIAD